MKPPETIVHLSPGLFTEREHPLVESGPLTASAFRYESGVCGLRLKNELGQLILLPFQGQQIHNLSEAFRVADVVQNPLRQFAGVVDFRPASLSCEHVRDAGVFHDLGGRLVLRHSVTPRLSRTWPRRCRACTDKVHP